jgi:sulfonate transport system substrate-binding protein
LDPQVASVSQERSLRLPTALSDGLLGSEQQLTDLFAESGQISSAPKFADWVDKRYGDALNPLLINR